MKKRIIIAVLFVALLSFCMVLIYNIRERINKQNIIKENITYIPNFKFYTMDSTAFTNDMLLTMSTVFIHFYSDCDFCHYEAKEITAHAEALGETQVLFVSEQSITKIQSFASKHGFEKHSNIFALKVLEGDFYKTFGHASVPNLFIYDSNKKLIKHFKGETKIEAILKYVN